MKFKLILALLIYTQMCVAQSTHDDGVYAKPKSVTGTIELGALIGFPSIRTYKTTMEQFAGHGTPVIYSYKKTYRIDMFEVRIIVDKMINQRLAVGGGVNFDMAGQDAVTGFAKKTSVVVPVYANVKYAFLKKKISPFIAGQLGAAIYGGSYIGGGAMGAFQFGLKGYVSHRVALNLSVGYRFQHIAYSLNQPFIDESGNNTIMKPTTQHSYASFFSILFGVTF